MNYLAHLLLSPDNDMVRLGNLSGDFLRGVDEAALPAAMRRGVALHREIDRFTDAHPVVAASRARVRPPHRRFAGVLVDVFYDHLLACRWDEHAPVPLATFTRAAEAALAQHHALLPPALQQIAPAMAAEGWLGSYQTLAGVERALGRIQARMRRPAALAAAAHELRDQRPTFERDFQRFFPELQRHTAQRWAE